MCTTDSENVQEVSESIPKSNLSPNQGDLGPLDTTVLNLERAQTPRA